MSSALKNAIRASDITESSSTLHPPIGHSDRLRDELAGLGWQIKDTPQGPKLKKV